MTQVGEVRVTSELLSKWLPLTNKELDQATLEMATDVHKRAVILAPKAKRNLVNSGIIQKLSQATYQIKFGSSVVPYARRRHFENKKNPQTINYLSNAGDSVKRGGFDKYLRK